jgi:hypothetical protein
MLRPADEEEGSAEGAEEEEEEAPHVAAPTCSRTDRSAALSTRDLFAAKDHL